MIRRDEDGDPVGVDREQGPGQPRPRIGAQVRGDLHPATPADRTRQPTSQDGHEADMGRPGG